MKQFISLAMSVMLVLTAVAMPAYAAADDYGSAADVWIDMAAEDNWKVTYEEEYNEDCMALNLSDNMLWGGSTSGWRVFSNGAITQYDSATGTRTDIINPRGTKGIYKYTQDSPYKGNHLTFYGQKAANFAITYDMQLPSVKTGSNNVKLNVGFKDGRSLDSLIAQGKTNSDFELDGSYWKVERTQVMGISGTNLKDDDNVAVPMTAALINADTTKEVEGEVREFKTDAVTGNEYLASITKDGVTTEYNRIINVKIVNDGGRMSMYAKWDSENNWQKVVKRYNYPTVSYLALHGTNAQITVSNFKYYQKAAEIVKTPETFTKEDFLADSSSEMISYPHFGTPAFAEPNGTFTAEVRSDNTTLDVNGWSAYLENEYTSIYCPVTAAVYADNSIYLDTMGGYKLTVQVPENTPNELMNLVLTNGTVKFVSPQSVSVVPKIDQDFYAVGVSDTHITKWKADNGSINEGDVLAVLNKQLRLGGARYLYHGGGIAMSKENANRTEVVMGSFVQAFEDEKIPLIIVAGNHEYDYYTYPNADLTDDATKEDITADQIPEYGDLSTVQVINNFTFDTFDRLYGMRSALISMGEDMVIAKHDYGAYRFWTNKTDEEIGTKGPITLRDALFDKWQAYKGGDASLGYRQVYQHVWNSGNEQTDFNGVADSGVYATGAFLSPLYHNVTAAVPYDLQATGHVHALYAINDKTLAFGGNHYDTTNWIGEGVIFNYEYNADTDKKWHCDVEDKLAQDPYQGEFVKVANGKLPTAEQQANIARYMTDFVIDGVLEEPALYDSYYNANNGIYTWNVANITNELDFNFYDGRVQFVMPAGSYVVDNGEIIDQYSSYDGLKTIVNVKVNIPAATENGAGKVAVSIRPTTAEEAVYVLSGAETGFVGADTAYLDVVSNAPIDQAAVFTVTANGQAVNCTVEYPTAQTARLSFTDGLIPQAGYSVAMGETKLADFAVLPKDYIDKEAYRGEGTLTTIGGSRTFDTPLKNFVMDITQRNVTAASLDKSYITNKALGQVWFNLVCDDGNSYTFYSTLTATNARKGSWHIASKKDGVDDIKDHFIDESNSTEAELSSVIPTNPVDLIELEKNYDFRIVRLDKTLSLYAKRTTDTSFDRIFTYTDDIVDGKPRYDHAYLTDAAGYIDSFRVTSYGLSNSAVKDVRLYEITDSVTAPEAVGEVFNVDFQLQPKAEALEATANEAALPLVRNGVKAYKADLTGFNWNPASSELTIAIPAYENVYGRQTPASTVTVKAAQYTYDMTAPEVTTLTDGGVQVDTAVTQNYAAASSAALWAVYDASGTLLESDFATITNGHITFKPTAEISTVKVFIFDSMQNIKPLAKAAEKSITE